ncbi:CoF synthetase [Rhodobacteraceae bacterium B1Z28]|uniref:CoF synthetase n=1 Tax=Ruegeria haliotis TaxID=2747601 RepID=A0ABX2PS16_9RHOB|nr:CoF synthetase [Ruegeria haliotis]NVO56461.1 CoF synthetase [Ruegeria haliotis]
MSDLWHIARAFASTRYRTRQSLSRADFLNWQDRALRRWLQRDVPKTRYYSSAASRLDTLPIVDKAQMMADFGAFNLVGISAPVGWQHFETSGTIGDISVGASTGTSGNRALYVITPQERLRWLGTILAKALPRFPFQAERVAVILPQSSSLYDTAARANRLELAFFDLKEGMERWSNRLAAFDPTCLVGPPRILRALAEEDIGLTPRIVYSSAETLDPVDRQVIEAGFALKLGQIYMATEGLFGVSCPHGNIHLAEDTTKFEFEPAGDGLVNPIVSCFQRQYQIMARYRMNDLLRLMPEPCRCGSPLQAVREIVGRMDDVFVFDADTKPIYFTPDVLRNAVLDADRSIDDFRILRVAERRIELVLPERSKPEQLQTSKAALERLIQARCKGITVSARTAQLYPDNHRKLRRVENQWQADPR